MIFLNFKLMREKPHTLQVALTYAMDEQTFRAILCCFKNYKYNLGRDCLTLKGVRWYFDLGFLRVNNTYLPLK
jgi:hypothetical protein